MSTLEQINPAEAIVGTNVRTAVTLDPDSSHRPASGASSSLSSATATPLSMGVLSGLR